MKVNYERLVQLNRDSLVGVNSDQQMSSYWLIHNGVERYLGGETITNDYENFLIQVGVLEPEIQEKIVKPFNFMGNDGPQSN
jgi:hypothetical protein